MDDKKLFEKLDRMIKLLGAIAMREKKSLKEQVNFLTSFGLSPNEIAEITGKSANLIRVTKFSLKGKSEKNTLENPVGDTKNE